MKNWGKRICIVGSIIAILFPPCKIKDMFAGWRFIFASAGAGLRMYHFIDTNMLLLELILINGIGLALFFIGTQQEKK